MLQMMIHQNLSDMSPVDKICTVQTQECRNLFDRCLNHKGHIEQKMKILNQSDTCPNHKVGKIATPIFLNHSGMFLSHITHSSQSL